MLKRQLRYEAFLVPLMGEYGIFKSFERIVRLYQHFSVKFKALPSPLLVNSTTPVSVSFAFGLHGCAMQAQRVYC